jgi:DNA transposition AAA+ family ATPase
MKTGFVENDNWRNLCRHLSALRGLSEEEPRIAVVSGPTGLGKTSAVRRYQAKNAYVYLRALAVWTPSAFLRALAHEIGAYEYQGAARCFEAIVLKLSGEPRHIIIDEANYLLRDRLLDVVRDLHDKFPGSIILAGEETLPVAIGQVKHFHGRVARWIPFQPLEAAEVSAIARELCEIDLTDAQAEAVRAKSGGEFRWIKKHLREIEAIARQNQGKGREITTQMIEMASRAINRKAA